MIALLLFIRVALLSGALWLAGLAARQLSLSLRRRVGLFSLLVLLVSVPMTLWLQAGLWNVHAGAVSNGWHGWAAGSPAPMTWLVLGGYALATVYLAGVTVKLLRFVIGMAGLVRMKTAQAPSGAQALLKTIWPDRRSRPVLRVSAACTLPFTSGLWPRSLGGRGVIVLPVAMAIGIDTGTLAAVLRHECQHLIAQDPLWAVLSRLTCALFWPIPFVHVLSAQFEEVQEAEADAAAVAGQPLPVKALYAECLIALAARPGLTRPVAAVCRAVGRSFAAMESRIRLILSDRPAGAAETATRRQLCRGVAVLLVLSLPVIFVIGVRSEGTGAGRSQAGATMPSAAAETSDASPASARSAQVPQAEQAEMGQPSLERVEQALRNDGSLAVGGANSGSGLNPDGLSHEEIQLRDGL